jgi:hypothetical protein
MLVLSDDELAFVGRAFDRAWDNHLKAGLLTPQNLLDSRRLLAARVLRAAYYGERDEWRLARDAAAYLRQVIGTQPNAIRVAGTAAMRPTPKRRTPKRKAAIAPGIPKPAIPDASIPVPDACIQVPAG